MKFTRNLQIYGILMGLCVSELEGQRNCYLIELISSPPFQRPTAHELLRHRFLKVARKTSYMTELIDRYRRWKLENSEEEELMDDDSDRRGK